METLRVRVHQLPECPAITAETEPSSVELTLRALGPFKVTNRGAERLPLDGDGRTLSFPLDTRGVEAEATHGDQSFIGYSERRTSDGIDVLLWPKGAECTLFDARLAAYPGGNAGQAVGYSPAAGVMLVAGGDDDGSSASGSLVFEPDTGATSLVEPDKALPQARAYATVTAFGSGLLVAGGENPLETTVPESREVRRTAAVYDPATHGFESELIELEQARTRHAALVLPNGKTLLVGGSGPGDSSAAGGRVSLVAQLEAVSPGARSSSVAGLARLSPERIEPTALGLDNGMILVGGGYDADGAPVTALQWLFPDAHRPIPGDPELPSTELPARYERTFIALAGGGALTVGGCEPAPPAQADSDACIIACGRGHGCPASEPDASWIAPDGEVSPVALEVPSNVCPALFSPEHARLTAGSDGSPWLIAFDESVDPPCRAVLRFDPWRSRFVAVPLELGRGPDPRLPLFSIGPDAFGWLTAEDPPSLVGVRTGLRGTLSQDAIPLLPLSDPLDPLHLAPDRLPPPELSSKPVNALTLPAGSKLTVSVTDALYDDVTVTVRFTDAPPVLKLGGFAVGSEACPWPEAGARSVVSAVRRGNTVIPNHDEVEGKACRGVSTGAVHIALGAGPSASTVTELDVDRN